MAAVRDYQVTDHDIYIDIDAFKAIGGRYIFSRIELSNAGEAGLSLAGVYTDESSPYTLYVYQTTSRYQSKEHSQLTFDEMKELVPSLKDKGIDLSYDDSVPVYLAKKAYGSKKNARGLRDAVRRDVEEKIANAIVFNQNTAIKSISLTGGEEISVKIN